MRLREKAGFGKRYRVRGFWGLMERPCADLNEGVQEDFRPVASDAEEK